MKRFSLRAAIVALTLTPLAVSAQGIDCNIGTPGEWIGGDQASSNAISFMDGDPVDLDISIAPNETHVALFEVEGTDNFRIEAMSVDGDTLIELRNENGLRIAEDDDSGGAGNSRIETVLDPGIYCIATSGYDGTGLTGTVRVGMQDQEALTADTAAPYCDADTAAEWMTEGGVDTMLAGGVTAVGSPDSTPYFKFTLDSAMPLSISARNEDADPVLYLFDSSGYLLAENDDYDGLDSRIDMPGGLEAGDYCVGIRALNDSTMPITVTLFEYDEAAIQADMYDNAEAAPPLDGSYPVEALGELQGRHRSDVRLSNAAAWYSVDIAEGGLLVVEGIGVGGSDPYLVLYDDLGRELSRNDDAGGGFDSMIAQRVFPGTYMIAVSEAGGPGTGSVRLVIERYVPAE